MKRLALITLIAMSLSSCADRTRVNCERVKNKALNVVDTTVQMGGGRCG
jgi:hypothetical protein